MSKILEIDFWRVYLLISFSFYNFSLLSKSFAYSSSTYTTPCSLSL